ncbi:MAG: chemotaxis protein CheW [Lachnospiraceae bacterium]|nr:chemotaxis protein CheW [Lachnospiraceae bacterium]
MEALETSATLIQYIIVKMGDEQFGIDISYIDNIVRMQSMTRVPKVADYIKGVINLRGEVIPVVSMRIKIGIDPDEYTNKTRIIIVKAEEYGRIGIIVDEVREVITLNSDDIDRISKSKDDRATYLQGVGKVNDTLVSILDLNALLSTEQA